MTRDTLLSVIALTVMGVWAIVAITSLFTQEFTPLEVVSPIAGIVVSAIMGFRGVRNPLPALEITHREGNGK